MMFSSSTGKPEKDFHSENMHRRYRRNKKNSDSVLNDKSLRPRGKVIISKAAKSSFIPKYRNRLSSILTQKLIRANLLQEVGSDVSLKQSSFSPDQQTGANDTVNGNISPKRADRKSKINCPDSVQMRRKIIKAKESQKVSESSLSESTQIPMKKSPRDDTSRRPVNYNLLGFSSDNEADQSSDPSEPDCAKRDVSERKDTYGEKCPNLNSPENQQSTEEKISEVETPNESLGTRLDNNPLERLSDEMAFDKEKLNTNYDTTEELVEVINTFENFKIVIPKNTFIYQASVETSDLHAKESQPFDDNKSNLENIVTAKLMGDIDLHLELENYLKAISNSDETGSCKVRTKNTLQQNHVNRTIGENTDFEGSFITENKLGMSFSACELNSSENSENTNEIDKSTREDSVPSRLFNEAKAKSSSSFKSALSICSPPGSPRDRNLENQFFVFLDRKIENFPVSLEYMDSKSTKDHISHAFPPFLEEGRNVKKIRSENDTSILQQDVKSKGHIKRTVGEMSLQPPQRGTTPPPVLQNVQIQNSLPVTLHKDTLSNLYEKMSPLEPYYEGKLKPNAKSSFLFENLLNSTSADCLESNIINIDLIQSGADSLPMRESPEYELDDRIEEITEEEKENEWVLSENGTISNKASNESIKNETLMATLNNSTENWSPSLQELIEIYKSVLKQNKKIRKCNINRVKRCLSSYLISFIRDIIKEKMHKRELISYAKEKIGDFKLKIEEMSNIHGDDSKNSEKKDFSLLLEYVNRFQELLSSSLSINQITRLNNIMAGFEDSSLENYTPPKTVNKKMTSKTKNNVSEKKSSKSSVEPRVNKFPSQSKQKNVKSEKRVINKKIKDVRETISFQTNKLQKRNNYKTTNNDKLKSAKEVKLPPSAELESVLKSYLTNTVTTVGKDSPGGKTACKSPDRGKNKFLVNVKLCQDKIIVNGMKQFKSEKALTKAPLHLGKETSDLIIESVPNQKIDKLKCSSKEKSFKKPEESIKKKLKKPEVKTSKQGTHRFKTEGGKHVKRKLEEIVSDEDGIQSSESVSNTIMQETASRGKIFQDEELFVNKFEYSHHKLKIQHPIEAILESSESKISERTVDNYNELLQSQEELGCHAEGEIMKDDSYVLSDNNLNILKSLTNNSNISNVGSGEEPSMALQYTKSYLMENPDRKNGTLIDLEKKKMAKFTKSANATNTPSLQSSKKSAPKKKKLKILASRPRSTYLCYPYIQCMKGDKVTKNKKGGKNRKLDDGSASSSPEGTNSSRKAQNKTKALKNISKGFSNLFKKTSERRDQQSKILKSSSNPSKKTVLEKKNKVSKISDDSIDSQVSNSKFEHDDESREIISFSINGFDAGSSFIRQNRSFVSLTSSQQPERSESDKHPRGCSSNSLKTENFQGNHSEYCNCRLDEDGECNSPRVKRSFTSQNSSATTDSYKRPTIVIHARNEGSDDVSFPSLMVLSESFMKCYSNFALSRTKIKSLFKSHSDMKFYPGRVVDNPEEQTPFVTFVLTPKQKEEAGVPDHQTKVVTKPKDSEEEEELKKGIQGEDFHVNFEQITHKNSLRAIEEFIEILSESRKKALKLKEQENKTNKTNPNVPKKLYVSASKPCPKKYKFVPCRRLQALLASKRKPYHECQKRLLSNKMENSKVETHTKTPISETKKNPKSPNTMRVTQISSRNKNLSRENELENPRKNNIQKNTETIKAEVTEAKGVKDNLELVSTRSSCIHQKEPNSVSDDNTPTNELNEITPLSKYPENFTDKKAVDETINECHRTTVSNNNSEETGRNQRSCSNGNDSERKMQMTKKAKKISPVGTIRNCKSADSSRKQMKGINNSKKLKTVKIHWTLSNSNKPETIEENSNPSFGKGIESQEISAQISDGERELLDSLLSKEEKLERKSSTYFDANEIDREENLKEFDEPHSPVSLNSWSFLHRSFQQSLNSEVGNLRPNSGYTNRSNEAYY